MAKPTPRTEKEVEELRARALLILEAFERAGFSETWIQFRDLVQRTTRLSDLRSINRDLRGAMAAMPQSDRVELEREMEHRFGPDTDLQRIREAAARARKRGRIASELEYRAVQAYADAIAGPDSEDEYLALGALLDEFATRPELPDER